jgi:hypothetical protein
MKKYLLLIGVAFAVSLAVVMGVRMSADAMAVIIGIIFGLLASIPTSVMLVWVLRQRDKQLEAQFGQQRSFGHYPPVVVVNGQGTNGYNSSMSPPLPAAVNGNGGRNFKVIGQENTETMGDVLPPFWDEL